MNTPICDFVRSYADQNALRLHMPGHKGVSLCGCEALDITEIPGADSLYEASGVILRSEENASTLFGCPSFYSTEGSSQCIRAMLSLALFHARQRGRPFRIAAGRNAHRTFISGAALLDPEIVWLCPDEGESYLSCTVDPAALDALLSRTQCAAVYITSPDYLGNMADIAVLSRVCRRHEALLMVDNAHGAYLRFLPESLHPIDLGADICCDSAHKTLPALTGSAYLHISPNADPMLVHSAKQALALFGSTSPSYLILQSLDLCNRYLADGYPQRLAEFAAQLAGLKKQLQNSAYTFCGSEALKLTIRAKPYGYTGKQLADLLADRDIVCEFADPDYIVFMLTPENGSGALERLRNALMEIPRRSPVSSLPPAFRMTEQVCSIREAVFTPFEILPVEECIGRVLAAPSVGCPPAVPIVVCGESIDAHAVECFRYYGIDSCAVLKASFR